jgi:lysozyme family protein
MAQYSYERLKPEYTRLWTSMSVTKGVAAAKQAHQIIAGKTRYQVVQVRTGVPWFVIGCLHMRESGGSFHTWLHNGDPMRDRQGRPIRTRQVPAGRPKNPNCTWEDGAVDAIEYEKLDEITDWCAERVAYAAEKFNGWGYRNPRINIPSPYLWGGTSVQKRGKFVRDRVYSAAAMDPQLGAMAVLRVVMELDPEAQFSPVTVPQELPDQEDEPAAAVSVSPKAEEGESAESPSLITLAKQSSTIKGTAIAFFTSISGWAHGLLDKLHDPVNLTLFLVAVAIACYAAWLAVTGRINAQKIIAHLADDNT